MSKKPFSIILRVTDYNSYIKEKEDFSSNVYNRNFSYMMKVGTITYDGEILTVTYNGYSEFIIINNGYVHITITKYKGKFIPKISLWSLPERKGYNLLWYYDCWSSRRITLEPSKFYNRIKKDNVDKYVIINKEAFSIRYKNINNKLLRDCVLIKNSLNKKSHENDFMDSLALIVKAKESIGWKVEMVTNIPNLVWDVILDCPINKKYDASYADRKNAYLVLLDTKDREKALDSISNRYLLNAPVK